VSGTFVVTGNLPNRFPSMVSFLAANWTSLPKPIVVQTLAPDLKQWALSNNCTVHKLLRGAQYSAELNSADLLIGHCGVGFLKDCLNCGRLAYYLPRSASYGEHIDDHQSELAELIESKKVGNVISYIRPVLLDKCIRIEPVALSTEFCRFLPRLGSCLVVTSVGGHYAECADTVARYELAGGRCVGFVVDEEGPLNMDDGVTVVNSCRTMRGAPMALIKIIWLVYRTRPDFILSHGAGVGALGVIAAKMTGKQAYVCESITRRRRPGRWFRIAYMFGAKCYAPNTADFISTKKYANVQPVELVWGKG